MSDLLTLDPHSVDECGIFKMTCSTNIRDRSPGGANYSKVQYPGFESYSSRIASFALWPTGLQPRPEALADAGFFFIGVGDKCMCFSCGGGLRDWEATDDPFLEHKKHFPKCPFIVKETDKERILKKSLTTLVAGSAVSEALLCRVCNQKQMCMTFLPCRHVSACESCASSLDQCPVCQKKIEALLKVYLPV